MPLEFVDDLRVVDKGEPKEGESKNYDGDFYGKVKGFSHNFFHRFRIWS